jgi:hypothetical protein
VLVVAEPSRRGRTGAGVTVARASHGGELVVVIVDHPKKETV